MPLTTSRAEMRMAAIYAALLCTACVLILNLFVVDSGNHSLLFGTWVDGVLQRVSAQVIAIALVCPIAIALIRQALWQRWGNMIVLTFCLGCAYFSVWLLVFMLQD